MLFRSPLLEPWQREIVRIVRKIAQYFYPQRQTQVMNEGWATFWHHRLLNTMYDDGYLSDGMMIEWLKSHTNVIAQPPMQNLNPYALGFAMYTDIKRICEAPTAEDREWFPEIAGADWLPTLDHAMRNFKDESFIAQYLSPKLMRDFRLFAIVDDEKEKDYQISAIHDEPGYQHVREALARLIADGLVLFEDNRGYRVAPVSLADFEEIARLREAAHDAVEDQREVDHRRAEDHAQRDQEGQQRLPRAVEHQVQDQHEEPKQREVADARRLQMAHGVDKTLLPVIA